MNKTIQRIFLTVAALVVLAILFAAFTGYRYVLRPSVKLEKPSILRLYADEHPDTVAQKVRVAADCDIRGFRWLTAFNARRAGRDTGTYRPFHPGNYEVRGGDSMRDIWNRMASGAQTPVHVVVGAFRTLDRLAASLGKQLMADSAAFAAVMNNDSLVQALGYNAQTLPALFIPNTYEVWWTLTPEEFMQRMQKENDRYWSTERLQKARRVALSPVEVATLASIVDEETNQKTEKPIVARLYLNRLSRGIPLQADPTVKFAVGDPSLRRILFAHLEVESPYNTYLHAGLPPGPIRVASVQGMEAVLDAPHHDYLYMCAKEDFSGFHNFSTTLAEHNAHARRYQTALNRRGIH
jgi:UPF0755 protein